jgi:hypothetical protein
MLALIETGRSKDWREEEAPQSPRELREINFQEERGAPAMFWEQVEACPMEIIPGPEWKMRWGAPDGRRNPAAGELPHDDLLISAALCAELDALYHAGKIMLGLANSEV